MVAMLSRGVDHGLAFAAISEAGVTSGRYLMMSVLSAAIATLGLLLSSPAVVIGAMLLSPLMGPIILLGFSFWTIDWRGTRRALVSLAVGLGLALAVAVVLTWLSPLKEPTAEILARTRPNLFDLLVAAFSGIAGGYAVIRQRGETVIGVAIATALMPPVATIGFGLGASNWKVAMGASLLFATNLIAIALAAALMAALYGFRPHKLWSQNGWIGHAAVIVVLGLLCVPLTLSLNTIALESRATVDARGAIREVFGPKARLASLSVRSAGRDVAVDGLVATPTYVVSASPRIQHRLQAALHAKARVNLDQVVLADPARLAAVTSPVDPAAAELSRLRDAVPFPTESVSLDSGSHVGVVLLAPDSGLSLAESMKLEQGLRARPGLEGARVVPPLQALAPAAITFDDKGEAAFGPELAVQAWAMQRWRTARLAATVCGLAPRDRHWDGVERALRQRLAGRAFTLARGRGDACAGLRSARSVILAPG